MTNKKPDLEKLELSVIKLIHLAMGETLEYDEHEQMSLLLLMNTCANHAAYLISPEDKAMFMQELTVHFEETFKDVHKQMEKE